MGRPEGQHGDRYRDRPGDRHRPVSELRHPLQASLPSRTELDGLLAAIADGDVDALRVLYDGTSSLVFGILHATLRSAAHAERATERVYVGLWRTAPRLDRPATSSALSLLLSAVRREVAEEDRLST